MQPDTYYWTGGRFHPFICDGSGLGLRFCCEDSCVTTFVGLLRGLLASALLSSAMGMSEKKKTQMEILEKRPHLERGDG